MSISEVEIARKVQQKRLEHPALARLARFDLACRAYHLALDGVGRYRDSTMKHGRIEWQTTDELAQAAIKQGAIQKPAELKGMLDLLVNNPPRNAMEIGTARGGTFFAIAHAAAKDARLTSVDLPGGPFGGGYGKHGKRRIESYTHPSQQLKMFQADSHSEETLEQVVQWLGDEPLDFLFIDGDHSLEGVTRDWEMYGPLVRKGGMVGFHDVAPHDVDKECQVNLFWERIKQLYPTLEFIEPPTEEDSRQWGGIGIILR